VMLRDRPETWETARRGFHRDAHHKMLDFPR
jgi:hypothetical protein